MKGKAWIESKEIFVKCCTIELIKLCIFFLHSQAVSGVNSGLSSHDLYLYSDLLSFAICFKVSNVIFCIFKESKALKSLL